MYFFWHDWVIVYVHWNRDFEYVRAIAVDRVADFIVLGDHLGGLIVFRWSGPFR